MSEPQQPDTPQRMSTRNQVRVNYSEIVSGGAQSSSEKNEPVFRSPTASTRGRKKRPAIGHDVSDLSSSFTNLYNNAPKRGRPRGTGLTTRRVPAVRRAPQEEDVREDRELVAAVKSGKKIPEAVDKWIERYNVKQQEALTEMHQFFFAICGCRGVVPPQMSSTSSFKDIICKMTEDFEEESADYPLVHGGNQKRIRTNIHNFIHTLIERAKSALLFDGGLMDGFVQLLTGMADSQVRAFRHTATFCAMKITSALVDVVIELTASKEKTTKQIEAEKAKMKNNAAGSERYEALAALRTQNEEHAEEIRQMIGYFFRSVFVHRYRDIVPDIRCICITELGYWMNIYPEHFVDDSYLKYIGWSLFDKYGEVRLKCIRALIPLFEKTEFLPKLELFVNKFRGRLVSMVLDKDMETSIETCHLMRVLYMVFNSLLTLDDVVPIYELIYASSRQLAMAAGMFLNAKVFMLAEKPTKVANPKNVDMIRDLLIFYKEGELHDHATYLVDALIDTNPIIKDWATMADMLIDEAIPLSSDFETKLCDVLKCSVEQSATGEPPVGRHIAKRGAPSSKEAHNIVEDRQRISEILIPLIPRILTKFSSDRDKVINLVTIPLHFQLDMYVSSRMQTSLEELLEALDTLIEKHVDEEVLKCVAELYYHLSNHTSIAALVESHKMKLLDGCAAFLRTSVQLFDEEKMGEDEEALFVSYIKRTAAFAGFIDMAHWNLWDLLMKIVANYNKEDSQRDVRERAFQMMFMQLNFDFITLKKSENPKSDQVRKLKHHLKQLTEVLASTLSDSASGVEQAYLAICDLMIIFGPFITEESKALEPLVWRPDDMVIANLKIFLKINVFDVDNLDEMEQQQRIELMHKMRQFVAQYAKLVIHGGLPIADASELMRRYQSHYTDFGDIFKNLLSKCREIDFVDTAVMIVDTLIALYTEMDRSKQVDPLSEQFNAIRDLAKRLVPAFGSDYAKNRFAVSSVHKKAIDFAFEGFDKESDGQPENIHFLEIAMEFSSRLITQDKAALVRYVNKLYMKLVGPNTPTWDPYRLYLSSLNKGNDDDAMSVRTTGTTMTNTTMRSSASIRGRGRGRRARIADDF